MPDRIAETTTPLVQACPVEKRCGACQMLSLPYDKQLARKQNEIENLFAEAVKRDSTTIASILGMDTPFYYRNKVISPFVPGRKIDAKGGNIDKRNRDGKSVLQGKDKGAKRSKRDQAPRREILCGMYERGTHRVIPTDSCLLENQIAKKIILAIRDLMPRHRVLPYNEDLGTGFLRHAVVRVGHESGEVLVTLVTNGEQFPGAKSFCRDLVKRIPEITTIVQNVNTRNTNVILGDKKERTLYGPGFILDRLCGLSFRISSHSFYQVNSTQTEVLYRKAIELANLQGSERILDAYCGTGTIGLVAACALRDVNSANPLDVQTAREQSTNKQAAYEPTADKSHASVIGVDKVSEAIIDARNNAKHNGIENATFVAQDAGEFMNDLAARNEQIDVLFLDPPRSGASEDFLAATLHLKPKRIVYISCNPKTQVRDIKILQDDGYKLKTIQPVDMFPHTDHIESIALLSST